MTDSAHHPIASSSLDPDVASPAWRAEAHERACHLAIAMAALVTLGGVGLFAAALWQGARLPPDQIAAALLLTVPAMLVAACVRHRWPRVATALGAMATLQLVAFIATGWSAVLTMRGAPLVDEYLVAADAWLGFDAAAWIDWAQRPGVDHALWSIYHTLSIQMLVLLGLLAGQRRAAAAWRLALQLTVAGALTLAVFAFYPAVGPFAAPEAAPTAAQQYYVEVFLALHTGADATVHLIVPTGLITFPSFHAAWALLVTVGYVGAFPRSALIVVPLNALVWLGSVTHGCHYLVDLFAGGLIALLAMMLVAGFATGLDAVRRRGGSRSDTDTDTDTASRAAPDT